VRNLARPSSPAPDCTSAISVSGGYAACRARRTLSGSPADSENREAGRAATEGGGGLAGNDEIPDIYDGSRADGSEGDVLPAAGGPAKRQRGTKGKKKQTHRTGRSHNARQGFAADHRNDAG